MINVATEIACLALDCQQYWRPEYGLRRLASHNIDWASFGCRRDPNLEDLPVALRCDLLGDVAAYEKQPVLGEFSRVGWCWCFVEPKHLWVRPGLVGIVECLGLVVRVAVKPVAVCSNVHVLVGQAGIEPTTSSSRTKRATKLRHCPLRYPSILRSGAWNAGRSCSVDYQFVDASPIHVANGEFEGFCGLSIAGLGDGS